MVKRKTFRNQDIITPFGWIKGEFFDLIHEEKAVLIVMMITFILLSARYKPLS